MRQAAHAILMVAALAALAAVALAHGKRAENEGVMSQLAPAPFVLGSRYGRSSARVMTPRNDRFFIGSRYGKRADPPGPVGGLLDPPYRPTTLLCNYTGVYSLYQCRPAPPPNLNRRLEGDSSTMEED